MGNNKINVNTYEGRFELMKAYAYLDVQRQQIIQFLFERDSFEGNFSDLTEALGKDVKKNVSNITKAVKKLNEMQLVYISYDPKEFDENGNVSKCARPKSIFLMDGWIENLICWYRGSEPWNWIHY